MMFILPFINGWAQAWAGRRARTMVHWWSQKNAAAWCRYGTWRRIRRRSIGPLFLLGMAWFKRLARGILCAGHRGSAGGVRYHHARYPAVRGPAAHRAVQERLPGRLRRQPRRRIQRQGNLRRAQVAQQMLWYIALANVFVYLLRYGVLDWAPTYLKEAKHFTVDKSPGVLSTSGRGFPAHCCAAGCRTRSSVATVA